MAPIVFDGHITKRCPLRPFKEEPQLYSEYFSLFSAREKQLYSEAGGYYDQPYLYNEIMAEMDSALSDVDKVKEDMQRDANRHTESLKAMGLNIVKK